MSANLVFSAEEIGVASDRLRHFAAAILEGELLYEIRPVPHAPGGSIWAKPEDFITHVPQLMEWNRRGSNPYFSINPRNHIGATKGEQSSPGSVVVADFDSNISLDALREKLCSACLPAPTAIVSTSANHWHVYWRLEERLPDLTTHKRMQRGLADLLGTCPNVCSHQQVMRLPGPFCNVKADRPEKPRVQLVECDPNRMYSASEFPLAEPTPILPVVPLEQLPIAIGKKSLSDASLALITNGQCFADKGRRHSIFDAARDMCARGWELAEATTVLVGTAQRLGLEPDDVADIPRQVRNAFSKPASPGYAASETARIEFTTSENGSEDDYSEELEALPLPLPPALPTRPEIALSHGVIGDFMRRVEYETEAHPAALAATLLVALGNLIGRGPYTLVSRTRHYVNLFVAIVGNTGAGRKGTGSDVVADCLRLADSHWAERCQSPNLVSGEGVIDALRDRVEKVVPKKDGAPGAVDTVVIDPGVQDKRLLITCAELVSAFKAGNRENSVLSQTLREAWDGKTLRTMAKNAARVATDPHLSIVGHATRQELIKVVRESDIFGGTYNRFLFILSERARLLPHGGNLDDLGTIPQRIADIVSFARSVDRMQRSAAADRLWESVYEELTTPKGSALTAAVLSRGEAQALRLSMLMALSARRSVIDEEDLLAALDLWRYSAASARTIFGGPADGLSTRLLEMIAAEPGISRSKLHRRLGWRVPAVEFVAVLARLRAERLVRCEAVRTNGRLIERWHLVAAKAATGHRDANDARPWAESCGTLTESRVSHLDRANPGATTSPQVRVNDAKPAKPDVATQLVPPGRYAI